MLAEAQEAVAVFEELGDDLGLARALRLMSDAHALSGRAAKAAEVAGRAAEHARRAESHREEAWALEVFGWAQFFGPTPVAEAIRQRELRLEQPEGNREAQVVAARQLAELRALLGRFAEAREEMVRSDIRTRDLGLKWVSGWAGVHFAYLEILADDPVAAERHLRAACELASDGGDKLLSACASVDLARALYVQGRYEESAQLTEVFDEVVPYMEIRVKREGMRAKLAARRGEVERAEALAREAVSLAEQTDFVLFHADALLDLAEVLRLAGRPEEAAAAAEEAVRLYERKGAVVAAESAQALLAELGGQVPMRP